MTSHAPTGSFEDAGAEGKSPAGGKLRIAIRLLGNRQRIGFVTLTVGRIAVGCCDLLVAVAMYLLFMLLQGSPPSHALRWMPATTLSAALLTAVLVAVRAMTDVLSARSVFRHVQNLYTDFLLRLTQGYNEMRWSRFVERNRGELLSRALYTAREAADFYHCCIEMTAAVAIVAIMIAALIYQSPFAACVLGGALAIFYGIHRVLIRGKLQAAASHREQSLRMLQRDLADMFSSGKEIRAYGNQAFFHERIRRQAKRVATNTLHMVLLPQVARIIADQGAVLLFLFILIAVELRQGDSRRLLSLLVFYFVLSRRMLPLISQISFTAGQMESAYENVMVVDSELSECRKHRIQVPPTRLPGAGLVMELDQVSFAFREDAPILRNVSLCLHAGEIVVLHGASGIGKSSLLNIIAGIEQPLFGVVRVDRASIAYVPQDIPLLDDTVRNNLLFGLSGKSDAELMAALAAARLDEFVAAQTLGLETAVGDNGALFSGGQRQRLGLARAMLRGGKLLLLDEATSALDEENERKVLENLTAYGRTVLLVTHRACAHAFAHRIFRLEGGLLFEESFQQSSNEEASQPAGAALQNY